MNANLALYLFKQSTVVVLFNKKFPKVWISIISVCVAVCLCCRGVQRKQSSGQRVPGPAWTHHLPVLWGWAVTWIHTHTHTQTSAVTDGRRKITDAQTLSAHQYGSSCSPSSNVKFLLLNPVIHIHSPPAVTAAHRASRSAELSLPSWAESPASVFTCTRRHEGRQSDDRDVRSAEFLLVRS